MAVIQAIANKEEAKAYAQYRPVYPIEVKHAILDYVAKEPGNRGVAVDVACGSGQATFMLADSYQHVHGVDISQAHLDEITNSYKNVTFSLGKAESLQFKDESVDLVTIAQGLRWVDVGRFYAEAKRVLKPGGVLAAFGHHYNDLSLDSVEANMVLYEFDRDVFKKHGCWLPGARLEDSNYADFIFPLRNFQRMTKYECISHWTCADIAGLISTTTAASLYRQQHPHTDVFTHLQHRLEAVYAGCQPAVTLPIFILLGRK